MITRIAILVLFIIGQAITSTDVVTAQSKPELPIGSKAPLTDHAMQTINGKSVTLSDLKGENGLLVVFTSNTCPWVHKWEGRYLEVAELASKNGIPMVALNPNEATRTQGESMEDMKKRAKDKKYNFIYAMDKDHIMATEYGANRTPHVYLFDKELTLVYRGAIDDNANEPSEVEKAYLKDAIRQLASGEAIVTSTSKSLGCTIKWLED